MTLDSLPDLDTSGLCLVKTLSTARVGRIGTRRSGTTAEHPRTLRRSPKGRPRYPCRPAPPRQTEALSSRTSRSRPLASYRGVLIGHSLRPGALESSGRSRTVRRRRPAASAAVMVRKNSSDSSSAVPSPSVIRQRHAAPDVVVIAATVANARRAQKTRARCVATPLPRRRLRLGALLLDQICGGLGGTDDAERSANEIDRKPGPHCPALGAGTDTEAHGRLLSRLVGMPGSIGPPFTERQGNPDSETGP